jgi:hypothetical protein
LSKRLGAGDVETGKSKYSIAEIFNKQTNKPSERKVGFI